MGPELYHTDAMTFSLSDKYDIYGIFRTFHINTDGKYSKPGSLYDYYITYNTDGVESYFLFERATEEQLYKILKSYNYLLITKVTVYPNNNSYDRRYKHRRDRRY
ncbi:HT motif family protein [Fowlpox virus]|nr:HT motif family protein [Fowlpox virus]